MERESLTSSARRVMYGVASESPSREGFPKERRDADREQGASGGDAPGGAVQEAGPDLRGGRDRRGRAVSARRRNGAPQSVVGGQGGDRRVLQRVGLLE